MKSFIVLITLIFTSSIFAESLVLFHCPRHQTKDFGEQVFSVSTGGGNCLVFDEAQEKYQRVEPLKSKLLTEEEVDAKIAKMKQEILSELHK